MKKLLRIFLCVMAVILCTTASLAHGGRTDINGGHTDKNNTSGLGRYHYHCDGNPAHLHEDGVCPYEKRVYYIDGELELVDDEEETEPALPKKKGKIANLLESIYVCVVVYALMFVCPFVLIELLKYCIRKIAQYIDDKKNNKKNQP